MSMTTAEVREALHKYYEDGEYLKLEEVGEDAHRQGRKIDMLVLTLWQSRGYQRDAIEIKVSMSDFRKEVKKPEKADFWWRYSNRFWIAAPKALEAKIRPELPVNWGLLSVSETGRVRAVVKPEPNRNPEPFTWKQMVGLIRCGADAGTAALGRSYSKGFSDGAESSRKKMEKQARSYEDTLNLQAYENLKAAVEGFEKETGITIADRSGWQNFTSGQQVGQIVNALRAWYSNPITGRERLDTVVNRLRRHAEDLEKMGSVIEDICRPIPPEPSNG